MTKKQRLKPSVKAAPPSLLSVLMDIRDNTAATAANTTTLRRDVRGIREGKTGADAPLRKDPLTKSERAQVERVKSLYFEKQEQNPRYSLMAVVRKIYRDDNKAGVSSGFVDEISLYNRVYKEINRR